MDKEAPDIEDVSEEDEALTYAYTISSYGADYPVDGLVARLGRGDIGVPPFQRRYVWKQPQASRFIESLLLGLPVPGIFLGKQDRTNILLVIDGQQRLLTLKYFYDGVFSDSGKEFALKAVQSELEGLTYKKLTDEQRRTLDDSIIHATIVRQDKPEDDDSSIYLVFERLNTGGTPLSAQEIRTCVSYGPFAELLKELNDLASWRELIGPINPRMKDQELILRFLALLNNRKHYARPMKSFLNGFMARNFELPKRRAAAFQKQFISTSDFIFSKYGRSAFRPSVAINAAVLDAVMVSTAELLERNPNPNPKGYKGAIDKLFKLEEFVSSYSRSTADEAQVKTRIAKATEVLQVL